MRVRLRPRPRSASNLEIRPNKVINSGARSGACVPRPSTCAIRIPTTCSPGNTPLRPSHRLFPFSVGSLLYFSVGSFSLVIRFHVRNYKFPSSGRRISFDVVAIIGPLLIVVYLHFFSSNPDRKNIASRCLDVRSVDPSSIPTVTRTTRARNRRVSASEDSLKGPAPRPDGPRSAKLLFYGVRPRPRSEPSPF